MSRRKSLHTRSRIAVRPKNDVGGNLDFQTVHKHRGPAIPREFMNKHCGEVCIVLGNGPSIADYDLSDPFFTENVTLGSNAIGKVFCPTYYFFSDPVALHLFKNPIKKCDKNTTYLVHAALHKPLQAARLTNAWPIWYDRRNRVGPPTHNRIFHGRTTGVCMLHVAFQMGFKYIFMLGIDGYRVEGERSHFYPENQGTGRANSDWCVGRCLSLFVQTMIQHKRFVFDLSSRSIFGTPKMWYPKPSKGKDNVDPR